MIYRAALVSSRRRYLIDPEPPLTRTNNLVRQETIPIYYGENQFKVVQSCDPYNPNPISAQRSLERVYNLSRLESENGPGTSVLRFVNDIAIIVRQYYWLPCPQLPSPDPRTHLQYFYITWRVFMSSADYSQQVPAPAPNLHLWYKIQSLDWNDVAATFVACITACNEAKNDVPHLQLSPWRPFLDRHREPAPYAGYHYNISDVMDSCADKTWLMLAELARTCPEATRAVLMYVRVSYALKRRAPDWN